MRVALLTLEALASAVPVRTLVANHPNLIAFVGLSDPYRPRQGGMMGQTIRFLKQSGPRLLPYMIANFSLPRIAGLLPLRRRTPGTTPATLIVTKRPNQSPWHNPNRRYLGRIRGIQPVPAGDGTVAAIRDPLSVRNYNATKDGARWPNPLIHLHPIPSGIATPR